MTVSDTRGFGLPTTWRRWLAALALCLALGLGVPWAWARLFGPERPVQAQVARVDWEDARHRAVIVHTEKPVYTTACPRVLISRWLLSQNGRIATPSEVIAGPLTIGALLPPFRVISTTPGRPGGSTFRIAVPDWALEIKPAEVILGVVAEASVPSDQPCQNGFHGSFQLYEILLPTADPSNN